MFNMLNFQFHNKVDFQLQSEEGDIGTFIANGEWALLGMFSSTHWSVASPKEYYSVKIVLKYRIPLV